MQSVEKWKSRLSSETSINRLPILLRFFKHVSVTPEEAVQWQLEHPRDYKFIDAAFNYLNSDVHLSKSTKRSRYYMIRGFFKRNRAPLPIDERPRFHSDRAPVHGSMSVDDLRKLLLSCNVTYRAIFLVMFQAGLGCEGLLHVNVNEADSVRRALTHTTQLIRLNLPGRKQNRNIHPYYSFIGSDAITALKRHLHAQSYMKDTVLFRTEKGPPVTRTSIENYFRSHVIQTGLVKRKTPKCPECQGETVRKRQAQSLKYICPNCTRVIAPILDKHVTGGIRYGKHPHELRDLFLTEWHRSGADLAAGNFMMGHSIDPLGYDKIMKDETYARSHYKRALPYLNILSEEPRKVDKEELEMELQQMRRKMDDMTRLMAELYKRGKS